MAVCVVLFGNRTQEIPEIWDSGSGEKIRGSRGGVRLPDETQLIYRKRENNREVADYLIRHSDYGINQILANFHERTIE